MVTEVPTWLDVGEILVIVGAGITVKLMPLLFTPLAFTTTFPVVAPDGTVTTMLVALHPETVADVPLNVTEPVVLPKLVPVIVTDAPGAPVVGERLEITGATEKLIPLLSTPLVCTTTFPVVAPAGTVTPILPALQLLTVAVVPLNLTVPEPWAVPKFDPVIVTDAPTAPLVIERLEIEGVPRTVKLTPFVSTPLA
jgi:hypothetical protein